MCDFCQMVADRPVLKSATLLALWVCRMKRKFSKNITEPPKRTHSLALD